MKQQLVNFIEPNTLKMLKLKLSVVHPSDFNLSLNLSTLRLSPLSV